MSWVFLGMSLGLRPWDIPRKTHAMPRSDEKSITFQKFWGGGGGKDDLEISRFDRVFLNVGLPYLYFHMAHKFYNMSGTESTVLPLLNKEV